MDLQSEIKSELWKAISQQYVQGHYSNAILDAIGFLRDFIRESANLDGDGTSLIGQAFGGDSPLLLINTFRTISQKDEQKGFEQILRGLFQGIRNPRVHDKFNDAKETADAVIVFVNYCIVVIQKSKRSFEIKDWLRSVFDQKFVTERRYAELLARQVPRERYNDVLKAIYQGKAPGNVKNLRLVFDSLLDLIGNDLLEIGEFIDVISNEFNFISNEKSIRLALQIIPPRIWPHIGEAGRMRIENMLIRSIEVGKVNSTTRKPSSGALGIYALNLWKFFTLKEKLYKVLLHKLKSGDQKQQDYVALYFWRELLYFFEGRKADLFKKRWVDGLCKAISSSQSGSIFRAELLETFYLFDEEWRTDILKKIEHTDKEFYDSLVAKSDLPF